MDGGQAPGGVINLEVNEEGVLINQDTGEDYVPGPDLPPFEETMPQWLWDQHNTPPPQEVEP